jgi:hypothetical protein
MAKWSNPARGPTLLRAVARARGRLACAKCACVAHYHVERGRTVAQLAFSSSGPVLPALVPSSSGMPMAIACSEAVSGLLTSLLSAMRCYTEGMVRERTRRGALLGGRGKGKLAGRVGSTAAQVSSGGTATVGQRRGGVRR